MPLRYSTITSLSSPRFRPCRKPRIPFSSTHSQALETAPTSRRRSSRRSTNTGHPKADFGILFIDIDHFKDFNDTYGHLLGDKVLRLVANTLRNNLRVTDSCGRWGGEEFIAVVYDLDLSGLARVAEKLRATISQTTVQEKDLELGVTVSIGSTLLRAADTFPSLIDRADKLMYESKKAGRNCVTVGE